MPSKNFWSARYLNEPPVIGDVLGVQRDLDVAAGRGDRRDVGLGLVELLGRLLDLADVLGRGLLDVLAALGQELVGGRAPSRWRRPPAWRWRSARRRTSRRSRRATRARQAMRTARSRGTAGKDNAAACRSTLASVRTTTSCSTSTAASGSATSPPRRRRRRRRAARGGQVGPVLDQRRAPPARGVRAQAVEARLPGVARRGAQRRRRRAVLRWPSATRGTAYVVGSQALVDHVADAGLRDRQQHAVRHPRRRRGRRRPRRRSSSRSSRSPPRP